jgi:catechol 2,3-dioxygenase-like lactoylglutathione lyase family enzyme
MKVVVNAMRSFVGSKDFDISRAFYGELGFEETLIDKNMSRFDQGTSSFYLQNYYQKDWLENTMLFLEVPDVQETYQQLQAAELDQKYPGVKTLPIKRESWGEVCFVIDPAGVLLQFGQFS